jgi:hypothetical protein
MNTDIKVNRLIREVQRLGRHRTKADTATVALREYIQRLKRREITPIFGTTESHSVRKRAKQRKSR